MHMFYYNFKNLYTHHKYYSYHIWNLDETNVQARQQFGARVIAKRGSQDVYNTIVNSWEWLTINCVVNATSVTFPTFYILRSSRR
jgi:hypothetical protein